MIYMYTNFPCSKELRLKNLPSLNRTLKIMKIVGGGNKRQPHGHVCIGSNSVKKQNAAGFDIKPLCCVATPRISAVCLFLTSLVTGFGYSHCISDNPEARRGASLRVWSKIEPISPNTPPPPPLFPRVH